MNDRRNLTHDYLGHIGQFSLIFRTKCGYQNRHVTCLRFKYIYIYIYTRTQNFPGSPVYATEANIDTCLVFAAHFDSYSLLFF